MKYKALFTDFDGTLYSDSFTISEKDIAAIKDYISRGGKFFISTGRLFTSIYPYLVGMGVESDQIIVSQGAEIYDVKTKQPIFTQLMSKELSYKVIQFVESYMEKVEEMTAMMYIDEEVYFVDRLEEYRKVFCDILGIPPHILPGSMWDYLKGIDKNPSKILVMTPDENIKDFVEAGQKALNGEVVFCESRKFLIEIMPSGIDKGTAVKHVPDSYGIDIDDVICVGDSDNDLAMIRVAGLGVATANALDRVKIHADYIAPSCNDSPIADIIYKFCL